MPNSPVVVGNSHYALLSKILSLLTLFSYYAKVARVTYNLAHLGGD